MELYPGESLAHLFVITGIIGGGVAWLAGRAIAQTWRPLWHVVCYMLLLGGGIRFAHFALGGGTLVSLPSYLVDVLFLGAVGCLGWRVTRVTQMVTQYPWLYQRAGAFAWRPQSSDDGSATQQ
jgi:hypothetical protein